jgi:protein involved in polysaccharide export with SLBB domain
MVLDSLLTVRFAEILRDPNLSVIVKLPAPQRVYVLGEVKTPGRIEFDDELTMVQAVAAAGGFESGALSNHAVLIRRQGVSKIVGVEVDLSAVTAGAVLGNDLRLRNYDIVYIPQHPIYSAAEFMQAVNDVISVPLDLVFKGWQIANLSASYEYFRTTNPTQ